MRLLIKFPSKNRSQKLIEVFKKYIEFAESPEQIKCILTLDLDDVTITQEVLDTLKNIHNQTTICLGVSGSKIKAVNRDMNVTSEYDIILLASDDMIPQIKGYDTIIRNKMKELYPDTDGVLWFNDGFQKNNLNTLCILGKKYYDRFGYIYNPEYSSLFCDNEFMEVANSLQKQTYIDTVIIKHEHPIITKTGYDKLYEDNDKFFQIDRQTYIRRKLNNFKDK